MNSELRLQISKHLVVDLNSLEDKFVSAYSLDGVHILPPLMTDIKRMEMQQLRLQALAIEMTLNRNKPTIAEKQIKCLMPRMVNASTNTPQDENFNPNFNFNPSPNTNSNLQPKPSTVSVSTSAPIFAPSTLVVLGRIRQKLQKSETAIFDHSKKELITVASTTALPLLKASHEVIKDAPQRAVVVPVELGTLKSSLVPKINSNAPLQGQRSTDTIDLRVRTGQDRVPERPVFFPSSTVIDVASTKTAESRFRSRIPIRRQLATVLTTIQPPEAPGHGSCQERNGQKTNSANERRRTYGAKVALKRNEMSRKREELAKLKKPPRTTNDQVPKSIRTPIRRVEAEESPREQQRFQIQDSRKIDNNNKVPTSIRTPFRRVEGGESPLDEQRFQFQEGTPQTYNNKQVPKSIRTPIRDMGSVYEVLEMDQQRNRFQLHDQQSESSKAINNQVPKSIRTPIRRVEEGESPLEQQHFQIPNSPKTNNNQVSNSIRRLETGFEEPSMEQKENLLQSVDQPPELSKTNNNQVVKSIRTPIRRLAAGIEESELLNQMDLLRSLASCQEAEQQRLQTQLEQEQQGLIDQLVGQIAQSDSQDISSEIVVNSLLA